MRAAIYCRLSEEDRNKKCKTDESESIQNQKSLLTEYCKKQNWEIVSVFSDEDMSGADRNRPEFKRMISYCEKGLIDVVVCKTQSRFSRDIEVIEHYIHNCFREWGVRFIGVLDHADTEDFSNKKSRQINGLVNEWYLEDLSENIKKTLRHKKQNGIYTGAFAPYGYKLDKTCKGKLFPDEEAAAIVRKIFGLYISGFGYVKIAKKLNDSKIPPPSEYKRLSGSKFKTHSDKITSKIWTDSVVREILRNEVYIGTLVQGKTEKISYKNKKRKKTKEKDLIKTENAHEPIIDLDVWKDVMGKISVRKRMEKTSGKRHVFAGKIFCEECGSAMWKMSYSLKNGRYEYLKCKATKCSSSLCLNSSSIQFLVVLEKVTDEVKKIIHKYCNIKDLDYNVFKTKDDILRISEEEIVKKNILKQNLNIKQLYKDKLDGIIDIEVYREVYDELRLNLECLKKRLSELEKQKDEKNNIDVFDYVENFLSNIILDEFIVSRFIEKITIGRSLNNTRKITIYWNF